MPADDATRALDLVRLLHATAARRVAGSALKQDEQGVRGTLRAAPLCPGTRGGKRRDGLPVLQWYGRVLGAFGEIADERRRMVARMVIVEYRTYREAARAAGCGTGTASRWMNERGGLWDWWEGLIGRIGGPPRGEGAMTTMAESENTDNG